MKSYASLLFCLSAILFGGCDDAPAPEGEVAVIEATFNSDGFPVVYFSSSISPGIEGQLSDVIINWGKVTVSDGTTEVVLSGRATNSGMPPFEYYSQKIVGQPGKTYTLTARYNDLYATSTMTMPFPTPIDSITVSPTEVDTLKAVTLHFTSPADVPACYYITLQENGRDTRPLPCMMGTLRATQPDAHYSIPVLRPKIKYRVIASDSEDEKARPYVAQLKVGEEWTVRLNRVDERVYEFWKAYDNMIMFSTSPFISTNESLPSNISGGLGIWSPQGSAPLSFKVPE